jgi:hypothetical protein
MGKWPACTGCKREDPASIDLHQSQQVYFGCAFIVEAKHIGEAATDLSTTI